MLRVKTSHLSIGSVEATFLTLERVTFIVVVAFHWRSLIKSAFLVYEKQ